MYMYYTGRARQLIVQRGVTIRQALQDGIDRKQHEQKDLKQNEPNQTTDQEKMNQRFGCFTLRTDWWRKAKQQQFEKRIQFPELKQLRSLRKKELEELDDMDENYR